MLLDARISLASLLGRTKMSTVGGTRLATSGYGRTIPSSVSLV
jgi:hypothetical protein